MGPGAGPLGARHAHADGPRASARSPAHPGSGGDHARARRDSTGPGRARARGTTSLGDHSRRAADPRRGAGARRRGGRHSTRRHDSPARRGNPPHRVWARHPGGGPRSCRRLRRFPVPEAAGRPVAAIARGGRQRQGRGEPRPAPHPLAASRSPQGHRADARGVLSVARGGHHLPGAVRHGPPRPLRPARGGRREESDARHRPRPIAERRHALHRAGRRGGSEQ